MTMIAQPSAGLGPDSDRPGPVQYPTALSAPPSAKAAIAFGLGKLPPGVLLLFAIISVQLGGALAAVLFFTLSPIGITFASSAFAAIVLTACGRPRLWSRGSTVLLRRHFGLILGFGAVNLALSLGYYLALERIPLGILATVTFLGPLGLAVATSRRAVHFLWIGIAAFGVALLTPEVGAAAGLDPI